MARILSPSVLWRCWLDTRNGNCPVQNTVGIPRDFIC